MPRILLALLAALVITSAFLFAQPAPTTSPLQGVWRAEEMVWVGGSNPGRTKAQPYFRIYTARHFSLVGIMSGEPRGILQPPKNAANLSDAEKLARYEHWLPFHGQAGTYEVKGAQVVHHWLVGKTSADTNRTQKHDFKLEGGKTLWLFNREGAPQAEFHVRYTKVE